MIHLGDITKIKGSAVEPVNVIIGGSPCQDLSIAGGRAGLAGERSRLFMEQIRVIKEMRDADAARGKTGRNIRPRWMVWENVPGAFSSNKGADFAAVLHETVKIVCPQAPVVSIPKHGWPTAGCLTDVGGKWSLAWRVFDAQFWGVPQRRKRITLVCDFGGLTAPEILFERQGLPGYSPPCRAPWQTFTADTPGGAGETSAYRIGAYYSAGMLSPNPQAGIIPADISCTLDCNGGAPTSQQGGVCIVQRPLAIPVENHALDCRVKLSEDGTVQTLCGKMGTGGGECSPDAPRTYCLRMRAGCKGGGKGALIQIEKSGTLCPNNDQTLFTMQGYGDYKRGGVTSTLRAANDKTTADLVVAVDCRNGVEDSDVTHTLQAKPGGGQSLNCTPCIRQGLFVRRLTPLECERLQGYPDGWTDIGDWSKTDKKGKTRTVSSADSLRYKALGNSIALPPWAYVLTRLSLCAAEEPTMASLFDSIGGFPLIWEWLNGKGSCLWASEIEDFPIAVTKEHFPDEDDDDIIPLF